MHFIENFQLCLSFYPRPNISDRFVNLASHFIRVQIFQILLWGTKWTVVNHALFYSTREVIENMESESELINRIFGHPAASKKGGEIYVKQLGGVFHKCSKSKYHSIHKNYFFGTYFVYGKTPHSCFLLLGIDILTMSRIKHYS